MATKKRVYAYLQYLVDQHKEKLFLVCDLPCYVKEPNNFLNRWINTLNYHLRLFYKSTAQILTGEWGMGIKSRGIFGIIPSKRSKLLVDSESGGNSIVGMVWREGGKKKGSIVASENIIVYPTYDGKTIEMLKSVGIFTKAGEEAWDNQVYYNGMGNYSNVVSEMFEKCNEEVGDSGDDNEFVFVDKVTPLPFEKMNADKHDLHGFLHSVHLTYQLMSSIGIGSLDTSEFPYNLSLAARDMVYGIDMDDEDAVTTVDNNTFPYVVSLRMFTPTDIDVDDEDQEFLPSYHYHKGSLLTAFYFRIKDHQVFQNILNEKEKQTGTMKTNAVPTIEVIEELYRQQAFELMVDEMKFSNIPPLETLRDDPVHTLLRIIAWNETTCCVPLHLLKYGFQEFFQIYSCEVRISKKYISYMKL